MAPFHLFVLVVIIILDVSNSVDETARESCCDIVNYQNDVINIECGLNATTNWISNTTRLPNVTTVHVKHNNRTPLTDYNPFPNLTTLYISSNDGVNLTNVFGTEHVTFLSLASNQLETLEFLKSFKNLKYLDLSNNSVEVVTFLDLPSTLMDLNLSSNKIRLETNLTLPDSLKVLNLSNNNLGSDEGMIFSGLLSKLDLHGNRLSNITPFTEFTTLEELYLGNNNISRLEDGTFVKLTSLIHLDLSNNFLESLGDKSFRGLTKLQRLDISENLVFSMSPGTFQFMNNLIWLKLSGNMYLGKLETIKDVSLLLGAGQRLQTIDASRTNLTKIPATLTRSVRNLHLSGNRIAYLQCGDLDSYPLLQVLDLTQNYISEIEDDALGRLEFLSHLLLSDNKQENVPRSLPDNLQVLDLRNNDIKQLFNYDFQGLQKLQVLLLSWNQIDTINDGAFGQLTALEILDLSGNPIKILSRTSFMGPRRLKELYLISLTELIPMKEALSFPAPESAHLEYLNLDSSPVLASQLMDDVAALTMFHELYELNLNKCNVTLLPPDLPRFLPRLHKLRLQGNELNCTNILWLAKWLQILNLSLQEKGDEQSRNTLYDYRSEEDNLFTKVNISINDTSNLICFSPEYLRGRHVISLKEEDFPDLSLTTTLSTHRTDSSTISTTQPTGFITPRTTPTTLQIVSTLSITEEYITTTPPVLSTTITSTAITHSNHSTSEYETSTGFTATTKEFVESEIRPKDQTTQTTPSTNTPTTVNNPIHPYKIHEIEPSSDDIKLVNKTINTKINKNISISNKSLKINTKKQNGTPLKWKYLKSESKYKFTSESFQPVLLNHSDFSNVTESRLKDFHISDNHTINSSLVVVLNETSKSDAFSAHAHPTGSHPGMFVFLVVIAVLVFASVVMTASHWTRYRRSLELNRGYRQQQDIEVRSLSSIGGNDLW